MKNARTLLLGLCLSMPMASFGSAQQNGLFGFSYVVNNGYVQITAISAGMPAANAGVAVGDWILAIDGYRLAGMTMQQVRPYLSGPVGKRHNLQMQRGNQPYQITLTRVAAPRPPGAIAPPRTGPPGGGNGIFGFNYSIKNGYVLVSSVTPGYPAARAGMAVGDWILGIDGYSLANVNMAQAKQRMNGYPGDTNTLMLQRNTQKFQVTMTRVSANQSNTKGLLGFNYEIRKGWVYVTQVTPGWPAARSGMMAGDWILAIDGISLANINLDTAKRIIQGPAGKTHNLQLQRGQQKWNVNMTRVRGR